MLDGSILPVVRYEDPVAAARWLCRAYGFSIHHRASGPDGDIASVVLRHGDDFVLIGPPHGTVFDDLMVQPIEVGNRSTQSCYITIADVDAHCADARKAGARVEIEPCDDDGGRFYMCRDPEGHLWSFGNASHGARLARTRPSSPEVRYRRPAMGSRAVIGLAILVGLALGGGATLYFGAEPTPQAMASWIGAPHRPAEARDASAQTALERDRRVEAERLASFATTRLAEAEAATTELKDKLDASQLHLAEILHQKQAADQALYISEMAHAEQLTSHQKTLDAAVRAKDQASQALRAEQQRALELQKAYDDALQHLANARGNATSLAQDAQQISTELERLKDANVRSKGAVELATARLAAALSAETELRDKLQETERQLGDVRSRAAELEAELKAARLGAEKAAQAAQAALATAQSSERALREKLSALEMELANAQASRGRQNTKVARLEGAGPDARTSPNVASSICSRAVRDSVFRHHPGSEAWQEQVVKRLCEGANATQEPAKCVVQLLTGKVDWGGGTQWKTANAINLCARTQSSSNTLGCFSRQVASKASWQAAIAACAAT